MVTAANARPAANSPPPSAPSTPAPVQARAPVERGMARPEVLANLADPASTPTAGPSSLRPSSP